MTHLGLDIGTKTIVLAYPVADGKYNYVTEVNGYWPFERGTPFVEHMLNDPNKTRSDGTKRPARWLKLENGKIIVLGKDAEELAYAKNDTLLRPMAEGGVTAEEESMVVLSSLVQGMLSIAERDVGKFAGEVSICYCTTAPAINRSSNIQYHEQVVNLIIGGYESAAKLKTHAIKESHAIVIEMSPDGTGIGMSFGAGTVTVSLIKYGVEIYSFCWVGAGDWIDTNVAARHGYDPEREKTRKSFAKETPTTISKRKEGIDLTIGKEPTDRIGMDIVLHYEQLIDQVVGGVISGFMANEANARMDEKINVYVAGGTSAPPGFTQRLERCFAGKHTPFSIDKIVRAKQPLLCVATGCVKAAEMF